MSGTDNRPPDNNKLGIWLMVATTFVFAMQDGISRHLAEVTNVYMVVMVRYWFFAGFVMALSARQAGNIWKAAATEQPILQAFRGGVLLAAEICVTVLAFTILGLVESHAVFACYPLIVAACPARCWVKRSAGDAGRRLAWGG